MATSVEAKQAIVTEVAAVAIKTPQQGMDELATMQGFSGALQTLGDNPLPYVLQLQPRDDASAAALEQLVADVRTLRGPVGPAVRRADDDPVDLGDDHVAVEPERAQCGVVHAGIGGVRLPRCEHLAHDRLDRRPVLLREGPDPHQWPE